MLRYFESVLICLPFSALVILYLIAAYNLTGVIVPDSKYKDFVIKPLAALAVEGAIFDTNTYMNFIPTIGQVVCTKILNKIFSQMATFCTDRENHKYQSDYDNSLTVKSASHDVELQKSSDQLRKIDKQRNQDEQNWKAQIDAVHDVLDTKVPANTGLLRSR